ncbi:MAG: 6,7-dimethyl-8-ribityllumazine synthase [Candidatus Sumerlaeia bacterium]|nr:6,7-dimethyl-8-ribityllumazine synthase [Candidatus Sumerlaeia bacterium]
MPRVIEGSLDAKGLKFALVVSRFNSLVTEELLKGALDTLARHGANPEHQTVVRVPGGWELPVVVKAVLEKGGVDGVIALGCVMKGQTTHNDTIVAEASKGLGQLAMATGIPVTFGVLTPNSLEQALERAGLKMGNKGSEAAEAAIETANLLRKLAK